MTKILHALIVVVGCVVVWIILNEQISWLQILLGFVFGGCTWYFTKHYLIKYQTDITFSLSLLWKVPAYLFFLLFQIYKAGIATIMKIVSGRINPDIVTIETELDNHFASCILANSITLTPGTVTVDKKGKELTVLWIDCSTKECKLAGDEIKGSFERLLGKR